MDALEALTTRRSAGQLVEPAPDDATLAQILHAAMRAPDHGRLRPWRFIALRGAARERFGEVMAAALRRREPDAPESLVAREREKPLRAPLILVAAAALQHEHKIPVIEQMLAAGAAAENVMLAAHALGFGAAWKTGAPAYDDHVKEALGLAPGDAIVGFLYLGTPAVMPLSPAPVKREASPALSDYLRDWTG